MKIKTMVLLLGLSVILCSCESKIYLDEQTKEKLENEFKDTFKDKEEQRPKKDKEESESGSDHVCEEGEDGSQDQQSQDNVTDSDQVDDNSNDQVNNDQSQDDSQQVSYPLLSGCDIFDEQKSSHFEFYRDLFRSDYSRCSKQKTVDLDRLSTIYGLYETLAFGRESMSNHCDAKLRNFIRGYYQLVSMPFSEQRDYWASVNSRSYDLLRRSDCSLIDQEHFSFMTSLGQKDYFRASNYLINPKFYIFENNQTRDSLNKFTSSGWSTFENRNVSGWTVKSTVDSPEGVNCTFLEIQRDGLKANTSSGQNVLELDSHCVNEQGQGVSHRANIALIQQIPYLDKGKYSLKLRAKKRDGRYGDLRITSYQRRVDTQIGESLLDNSNQLQDICHEIDIVEPYQSLYLKIEDSHLEDASSLGLLVESEIKLEKGNCL